MKNDRENLLIEKINTDLKIKATIQRQKRIWINIKENNLIKTCNWLKKQGFDHLSAISVTDLIEEEKFEITYHLWSYQNKILLTIKTKIDRKKPVIQSVIPIYNENAQIHERELHELFGVKFQGNPDLTPLFLEDWHNTPPFKKDFNWRDYVKKDLYDKKNERETAYYD